MCWRKWIRCAGVAHHWGRAGWGDFQPEKVRKSLFIRLGQDGDGMRPLCPEVGDG